MSPKRLQSRPGAAGRGHLLILLMVGITVLLIMLTVAAQAWSFRMRREMELELIFRGEQYVNALEVFRKTNGGAFPVGDLAVLAKKGAMGQRFIRKLYTNPFDPNGEWQYLYLHPGGTGFINPCAHVVAQGGIVNAGMPGAMPSQVPVPGLNMGGGMRRGSVFNTSGSLGGGPATRSRSRSRVGSTSMDQLSALDPETFKETGIAKMNLPIVGVVDCEQGESIRTYKSQTWLSNWAFTPLAQGEFGGIAHTGRARGASGRMAGGLGLHGGSFTPQGGQMQRQGSSGKPGTLRGQEDPEDQAAQDSLMWGTQRMGRRAEGWRRTNRDEAADDEREEERPPDEVDCQGEDCEDASFEDEEECEGDDCEDASFEDEEECEGDDCEDASLEDEEECEGDDCGDEDDGDDGR